MTTRSATPNVNRYQSWWWATPVRRAWWVGRLVFVVPLLWIFREGWGPVVVTGTLLGAEFLWIRRSLAREG